jgi:hypothetical protein
VVSFFQLSQLTFLIQLSVSRRHMFRPPQFPWCVSPNNFWWSVGLIIKPPVTSSILESSVLPSILFSNNTPKSGCVPTFSVVEPCGLADVYRRLHQQGALMRQRASTGETSINFYQTARHNNPEDSPLHTRHCENLKSQNVFKYRRNKPY